MNRKNVQSDWNRLGLGHLAFGVSAVFIASLTVGQMPLTAGKPPSEPALNPKFDRSHRLQLRRGPVPQANFGSTDAWVAKLQDDKAPGIKKPVWKNQLGTSSNDVSYGVATDSSGNVFISGSTQGALGGNNKGLSDAWVAKYSPDGLLFWKNQLGTSSNDVSYGVATDSSGNVFISGSTQGALGGNNKGLSDAWVAKYSPDGLLFWKNQLGTSSNDVSYGVATDSSGNVFISGSTQGALGGNNKGLSDAWVAKYSPDGALLWKNQLGTPDDDGSAGVATDSSGNVFISGGTEASLGGSNKGSDDAWVAKYSPNGSLKWTKQLGSIKYDYSFGITTDSGGNVFISGLTQGVLSGSNQGKEDAWVAKYSPNGALKWTKQLGSSEYDSSLGVVTDGSGNVFISGRTEGALVGSNQGKEDAWVAKYSSNGSLKWVCQVGTSKNDYSYGVATDNNGNVFISGLTNGNFSGD